MSRGKRQKNHSGAKKRFRTTAKGKIRRRYAATSHLMEWKSNNNKRRKSKWAVLSDGDQARYELLLPYGKK